MCGLLGVTVNPNDNRVDPARITELLTQLMVVNEDRGGDSYGLSVVPTDGTPVRRFTRVGRITSDLDTVKKSRAWRRHMKYVQDMAEGTVPFTVIGHNRKATHGDITERNQMPFVFGRPDSDNYVVGAHNGVISQHELIAEEVELKHIHREVDSEIIFRGLQVKNAKEFMPLVSGGGSAAVTWFHNDMERLHMFRNRNPLHLAFLDGLVFWSSEQRPLRYLVSDLTREVLHTQADKITTLNVADAEVETVSDRIDKEYLFTRRVSGRGSYGHSGWDNEPNRNAGRANSRGMLWDTVRGQWVDAQGSSERTSSRPSPASYKTTVRGRESVGKCFICSTEFKNIQLIHEDGVDYCPWCAFAVYTDHAQPNDNA